MKRTHTISLALVILIALLISLAARESARRPEREAEVTRATLGNGLRIVIVRDPLAPVITVQQNYLVGADETPQGFPGMAHAQEHMAFRGCSGVTADQTAAIYAQLGGLSNADTQQTITQYFTTVPATDVEVALRLDAACMRNIVDAQTEWLQEKGAIEQEVARDLSSPTYKFLMRVNENFFAGTPYAHDALGTHDSFEATTGEVLKRFYDTWYAPNNAILVVAGDVQPDATLRLVEKLYGDLPRKPLPARPDVRLGRVKHEQFSLESDLPSTLAFVAYRFPGSDSLDFAAAQILADVLVSERGNLYALVPRGDALSVDFELAATFPKASVALSAAAVPTPGEASGMVDTMRSILADYVRNGVPPDLVEAAKRREIAEAAFARSSIPGLAAQWSQALAAEGRESPDDALNAIRRVTPDDVNRVAREFLNDSNSVVATLIPKASGEPVVSKGFGGAEQLTSAPSKPVALPAWAESALATLRLPPDPPASTDLRLPNQLRLIVRTDRSSPTVTVLGNVRHEASLQAPAGKEGVGDVLEALFSYGTTHLDRLAFRKSLDDITASESAGYDFSLQVLKADFPRGVELLADNLLHPALPADGFKVVRQQTASFLNGEMTTPAYRASRALLTGLLPPGDPALREATPKTVAALTLDDVRRYHASTFRPDLTTIVVVGDIAVDEAQEAIARWFGEWKATGPKPNVVLPRIPVTTPAQITVPDPTAVQASVVVAEELGLTRTDPDYYALQLGDHVLGGGFYATRLYRDLRQQTGYVYTVDNSLRADKTRSVYAVNYGADLQNVARARDLIVRDLQTMQREQVSAYELHQAKAILLRRMMLDESSAEAVASGLLRRAQADLPLDEPARAARRYFSIPAEEIRAAFAKWIRPEDFVQVVRTPQ